ncbi:MAG TPA: alpha/beta fold hydrolase [Chloroflexota bacterium]|nr:alpha/beta fold hydrolase [Chloroflexota bacterium]
MAIATERGTGRDLQAAGITIHYNEVGSGYPVIMLHGAGPGASSWSNFSRNVDAFAANYRALLADMPQYGGSSKVVIEGGRLTYCAEVFRDFMDKLGIEKAHFVGNSMGGQVAIKLAIDSPERVSKLVIIGSGTGSPSLFCPTPLEGIKLIGGYYKGSGPSRDKLRTLLQTLLYDPSFLTDETLEERYQASVDPEVVEVMTYHPPAGEALFADLHKVACPALIVWGADDRFGALDGGLLMLRSFQNARMHIFSRCGHWAQVEHAEEFNRLVLEFLEH